MDDFERNVLGIIKIFCGLLLTLLVVSVFQNLVNPEIEFSVNGKCNLGEIGLNLTQENYTSINNKLDLHKIKDTYCEGNITYKGRTAGLVILK